MSFEKVKTQAGQGGLVEDALTKLLMLIVLTVVIFYTVWPLLGVFTYREVIDYFGTMVFDVLLGGQPVTNTMQKNTLFFGGLMSLSMVLALTVVSVGDVH